MLSTKCVFEKIEGYFKSNHIPFVTYCKIDIKNAKKKFNSFTS